MTIFNDFSENDERLRTDNRPLDKINLALYIKQYGIDRSSGYHDAMGDLVKQMDEILFYDFRGSKAPNTPASIRRDLRKFYTNYKDLHEQLGGILSECHRSPPDPNI